MGVFMFRHFTNQLPNGFRDSFSKQAECHKYHTRNANDYTLTRNKKVFSDQTVRTSGPILWNSLHQNLKMSKTVKHFQNHKLPHFTILITLVWSKKYLFVSFCWVQVFFPLIYLSVHCSYLFYSRFYGCFQLRKHWYILNIKWIWH